MNPFSLRALLAEHIDQWDAARQPVFLVPIHRGIADKPRDDYSRPANMSDSVVRYRWEPCEAVIGRETFKARRLLANGLVIEAWLLEGSKWIRCPALEGQRVESEERNMRSKVHRDQFEWRGDTLVHKPTGAEFEWRYPGSDSDSVTINWKRAGDVLPSGEDFDREDIGAVAADLLAERRK